MLDIPVMGVNAPWEHQRIIRKLSGGLGNLYDMRKIPYEPLPEAMIDESATSATPDVLLIDPIIHQVIILIEISAGGFKKDFLKISALAEDYEAQEGFVYNYIKNTWRKYKLGVGEITENPSFCDSIGYDLNEFLK